MSLGIGLGILIGLFIVWTLECLTSRAGKRRQRANRPQVVLALDDRDPMYDGLYIDGRLAVCDSSLYAGPALAALARLDVIDYRCFGMVMPENMQRLPEQLSVLMPFIDEDARPKLKREH